MQEEKVKAIKEWKEPKTVKQVQAFLGFVNFYRRFVPNFSRLAKPLTTLTKKDMKWQWEQEQQDAFNNLKSEICKEPLL
jgi:hypothetical protein